MGISPKLISTAVLAASLIACGGQDQGSDSNTKQVSIDQSPAAGIEIGTQTLSFDLNVRSALAAGISASNAKVTITKGELERTQNINLQGDSATVSFTSLPVGEYQVAIEVMDGTTLVAQGSGTASVNADTQSEISLVLNPVTGNLQVNLCMPDSGVEYTSGSYTSSLSINPNLATSILEESADVVALKEQLTGKTNLSVDFKFGDGVSLKSGVEPGSDATFNKTIDHGAQLVFKADDQIIADVSGCNTEVVYEIDEGSLLVVYKITDNHNLPINVKLGAINAGQILTDGLSVVLSYRDTNGDAVPEGATRVSDIDIEKFETLRVYAGVPRMTGATGLTDLLLSSLADLISQRALVAESAEIDLSGE